MENVTIKILADELQLSAATVSKALNDSHEISDDTKKRVLALARKLNYIPNIYASSLRKRKSKTIAVVIPEVADSFFAQAINGIETIARDKGYHVLIYLTHEDFLREQSILKDFQSGRVDGVLISITSETTNTVHIQELHTKGVPIVFFDRVCEEMDTAKITTDDFESSYKATQHLVACGCRHIGLLSISKSLSISNQRMDGYKYALAEAGIQFNEADILFCSNDEEENKSIIKKLLKPKNHPDGLLATVEKLTTSIYLACEELHLLIPKDVKVICFSNLQCAPVLNPSLTTITQPAFDMGKVAASLLFKALGKKNFDLKKESLIIPSVLQIRNSTNIFLKN